MRLSNAATRSKPISLDAICGTYHWFYEIPAECFDYPSPVDYDRKGEPPGHLTLSIPAGSPPTPENLSGDVNHFGKLGTFTGLAPIRIESTGEEILNVWSIKSMQWEIDYGDNTEEGNELIVLDAKDDDGHPFIMFRYGPATLHGGFDVYLEILAKRLKEGSTSMVPLTDTEKSRWGIGISRSEIAQRAQEKDSGEEGEEDEAEEDGEVDDPPAKPVMATKRKVCDAEEDDSAPRKKTARN
ncbi:hypothetical protein Hypma_009263 [Hypsizygus marmoreus]|uniref:Uncharacterized protein n=1 Tax=Hypsizygus marmoreus TaxID=39966 RepID=A0A369JU67_HYPMA|nr:hypothetical protein Hypma_009263 [Hypsizygus marmoreus]